MGYKTDFGVSIKFTDEDGTQVFHEGSPVVCYAGNGNVFAGKITSIGTYRKNQNAEPEQVICLDTSRSEMSYSGEIIRVKDITYISRYPLDAGTGSEIAEPAGLYIRLLRRCRDISLKTIEVLDSIYDEAIAEGNTEMPEFDEVLRLVTKNMEHLLSKEKIKKLIEGAKETVVK